MNIRRTIGALLGVGIIAAGIGIGATPADAKEYANHNYLGILNASKPTGYPVSPASLDISGGPVGITVSVAVQNLTATEQIVPMDFSLHHILTFLGEDVSDGQPGEPGITFPAHSKSLITGEPYGLRQKGTFTIPASGSATISFDATMSICGYFQVDFNHKDKTLGKRVLLAAGFTRVLGCQFGPRLTPGFWKNHETETTQWLPQLLGDYPVNTFDDATGVFDAMKCSEPANCLAGHLLAAQLDVASGASPCIAATIADANAFLQSIGWNGPGSYTLTDEEKALALSLEVTLDDYTNDTTDAAC